MIAAEPDKVDPWLLKLGLLSKLDDDAATESHLNKMVERFPEDQKVHATLASWYVSRDQIDQAEQVIRGIAAADTGSGEQRMALIQFLEQHRGLDAAMAEAERLAAESGENVAERQLYDSLRAYYLFNGGERDRGIELMRTTLTDAAPSQQTNRLRAMLAGMLMKTCLLYTSPSPRD